MEFVEYMALHPINPVSMVVGVVIVGIVVLFINAKIRKRKAGYFLVDNPDASILILGKLRVGDVNYADSIQVVSVNNQKVNWFFYRPMIPAIYIKPGHNEIVLYAKWARSKGGRIANYKSEIITLPIDIKVNERYSLEFHIPENKCEFKIYEGK